MFGLLLALIYLCFISLGLPDSLLGAAWPVLHGQLSVPMSYAGIVSMIISGGTIVSSLFSDRLLRRFGTGKLTALSIALTAAALFGFSLSDRFWMLVLWAIPYGLGAGAVDAALNNHVALYCKPQHMSWLHCMWGVGATVSPYIMQYALVQLERWDRGYWIVAVIQGALALVVFCSLPLWKKGLQEEEAVQPPSLSFREIFAIPGARPCFFLFFLYCALEMTTSLWASTYLVKIRGVDAPTAAGFASFFYLGLTAGRGISGFLAMKCSDRFLIRLGMGIVALGIVLILLPIGTALSLAGFIIAGLGCAPIYPCVLHTTPDIFGRERSQAMIGMQMAFAYVGFLTVPPLFGALADATTIGILPMFLLSMLATMVILHETVVQKTKKPQNR